jgi:hypothetical protein
MNFGASPTGGGQYSMQTHQQMLVSVDSELVHRQNLVPVVWKQVDHPVWNFQVKVQE